MSMQILAQTSDNIQKLFDLSTRIDERVKSIQSKQDNLERRIEDLIHSHTDSMRKIAVLESQIDTSSLEKKLDEMENDLQALDKRLATVETYTGNSNERWKSIASFVVQLIWVILAAYLLTKLNLQSPAVP